MAKRIRVRGIPRPEPDVRLYVLALIELARQLQEEEAVSKEPGAATRPGRPVVEGPPDD
jgi:hypothetical protein